MDIIKTLLRYEPDSGELYWLANRPNGVKAGEQAGSVRKDGYRYICVDGVRYYAQVIIWFLQTGKWPADMVDHKNRQRDDNRWDNLREATRSQNISNAKLRVDNSTGFKGVFRQPNGFRAQINAGGVRYALGVFKTLEEAAKARKSAEIKYHKEFRI